MLFWIVLFSVALDFTSTLKCEFLSCSKYTAAFIYLWSNENMLCVVRAYSSTPETKFSVLSISVVFALKNMRFYTLFAFSINSFNNNISSNCYVIVDESLFLEKKKKYTLWHYEDYSTFVELFTQLSFILLYNHLWVQFFVLYLSFALIYICCYSQYSLKKEIQYFIILSVLCTRLVRNYVEKYALHTSKIKLDTSNIYFLFLFVAF